MATSATTSPFDRFSDHDLFDLVDAHPLAWLVPANGGAAPSLLPLLPEVDGAGRVSALFGHMARTNPLAESLMADAGATLLFTGPHAFLPTSLVSDPAWAPTWVFAQASFAAQVAFVPEETGRSLDLLTERLEGRLGTGWQPRMAGPRYAGMVRAIVAFRATVTGVTARFKLAQDETPDRRAEILAGLDDPDLAEWIRRFNP